MVEFPLNPYHLKNWGVSLNWRLTHMNLQSDFGLVLLDLIIHGSDCFPGKFYIFLFEPCSGLLLNLRSSFSLKKMNK